MYFLRSNGEIDRYKARLVAQGFDQKEGIDYEETFSLVVKMVTVKCLLNVAISNSWHMFQLDVNNAFLYGDLVETAYMKPPEGYFPSGNKVCRLKKSLYGLKQAPRQWNAKLTSTLIKNGFSQSKSDYSLCTKSDNSVFLFLLVYVDDIIITGNNILEIEKFKKYVLDLLSEYGMLACKPAKTPLVSKLVISNEATENDHILDNIIDYQKLMDKLIYLTNTRLDISYVVHYLSQFMHSSLKSHLKVAFKVLKYLKSCLGLGSHIIKDSDLEIDNLLHVAHHCDSNSAIKIAANLVFHERTKHLEIDLHFVREKILKGVVKTVKIESANQITDILTKELDTLQHKELVKKLGMFDIYQKGTLYEDWCLFMDIYPRLYALETFKDCKVDVEVLLLFGGLEKSVELVIRALSFDVPFFFDL
ncbi:ribonuclease H-like domain-containing protein [Tanacetum coccineum]